MMCSEREQLLAVTASIQCDLERDKCSPCLPRSDETFFLAAAERALRIALFSAEVDLAFHQAKCLICRAMDGHADTAAKGFLPQNAA
jgi:hypothetical protein